MTIKAAENGAEEIAQEVKNGLGTYTDFRLTAVYEPDPIAASTEHDVTIGNAVKNAMTAWESLITADAEAVSQLVAGFQEVDADLAAQFMGVGE